MYSITIPENYEIVEMPQNLNTMLSDSSVKILFYYQATGNIIQIKTSLNINKLEYSPSEYPQLKSIFELWEQKHNEMILLKNNE
jgi:uncharacterized protein DUF3858